jgi:iron complex outermembrane receptor protein
VVTGSLIRGVAPLGSVVTSIDEAAMAKLGVTSTADVLRTVPSVLNLGYDPSHTNANQKGNANTSYATGINLRGIGTADTLVLVDGHRIAPSGIFSTTTDPNAYPQLAVSRIEVAADGASAVYGSDAVSGVVNILLRKPFNGIEVTGRYGGNKGGNDWQLGGIAGHKWDLGGNAGGFMFAVQHTDQERIKQTEVSDRYTDDYRSHGGPGVPTGQGTLVPGTIVVGTTFYALPAGGLNTTTFAGSGLVASTTNPNVQSYYFGGVDVMPQLKRDSMVLSADQSLFDNQVKLYAQANYSKQKFDQTQAAGSSNLRSVSIPSSNPFYITGVPGVAAGANLTVAYSSLLDFGPVHNFGYETVNNATVGATIVLPHDWQLEPSIDHMTYEHLRTRGGLINNCAFSSAPGTVALNGQVCTGVPALRDTSPLTAFNPFKPGSTNPATIARILGYTSDLIKFERNDVNLRADGPLFDLPGGAVRMAIGASYTRDTFSHRQIQTQGGFTQNNTGTFSLFGDGKRNNKATYAEFFVPLVGDGNQKSFTKSLALSVAVRHETYSDFGGTTNPKYSVNWKPVNDLTLHVSYGTSFRAPTIAEISGNVAGSGAYLIGASGPGTITVLGGQVGLQPEKAKTWSYGLDITPAAIKGLKFGLNYFSVEIQNLIFTPPVPSILNDPAYAQFKLTSASPRYAPLLAFLCTGNPLLQAASCAGVTTIIDNRSVNSGSVKTSGIEYSANYAFDSRSGSWSLGAIAQNVDKFDLQGVTGGPTFNNVNKINYPLKMTGRLIGGWSRNGLAASAYVNYANSYINTLVNPVVRVKAYTTTDLTLSYDTGTKSGMSLVQNLVAALRVTNLFDSTPPYVQNFSGSGTTQSYAFDPENASGFGRAAYMQVTKKF